jgi:excisionase family DNA binding protein
MAWGTKGSAVARSAVARWRRSHPALLGMRPWNEAAALWDVEGMVLLTIEEAASRAKLSPRTIRRMIRNGVIQAQPFGSGSRRHRWRIPEDALVLKLGTTSPQPAPAAPASTFPTTQEILAAKRRHRAHRLAPEA